MKTKTYTVTAEQQNRIEDAIDAFEHAAHNELVAKPAPAWVEKWDEVQSAYFDVFQFTDKQRAAHAEANKRNGPGGFIKA